MKVVMLRALFARPDGKLRTFCVLLMLCVQRDVISASRYCPANGSHKCEICESDYSILGYDAVCLDKYVMKYIHL